MKFLNELTIGKKLYFGYGIITAILVILSFITFINFGKFVQANNWNIHTYKVITNFNGIVESMLNMETGQRGFSITGDEKFLEPFNIGKKDYEQFFNEVKSLTSDNPQQQENLKRINDEKQAWLEIADKSITMRRTQGMEQVINFERAANGKTAMDNLRRIVNESIEMEEKLLEQRAIASARLKTITDLIIIIGTLIAFGLAGLIAFNITKNITTGIQQLMMASEKLALGDVNFKTEITSKDEIGTLMISFNKMVGILKNLTEEVNVLTSASIKGDLNTRGNEDKFEGSYREIITGINRTMDVVVEPMYQTLGILQEMAKGNLDIAMDGDFQGDFAKLKEVLNYTIDSFNELLDEINVTAVQVAGGSKQVAQSAETLSQGSTEQASTIEELTSSVEVVANQTKQNALNANKASELAFTAKEVADQGNQQMKDMLEAMENINEASASISKIIKVIDEIAFQTNILALNAAVEAARAGQHGKGFAVVAEEVRNLAARSSSAAQETTTLIEGSIKKVERGSKIANDTAVALNEIVDSISKVDSLVGEIAKASNDQASAVTQINQGIVQVSQIVQLNSATSEESASASEELSSQAENLKEKINQFTLKRRDNNYRNIVNSNSTKIRETYKFKDKNIAKKRDILLPDSDYGKY